MLIKLACVVFFLIASIFYINILVSVAACATDNSHVVTNIDTLAMIVEPENAETIASSGSVVWMCGLIEVDLEYIVRVPWRVM
jgi:hypothetical protein